MNPAEPDTLIRAIARVARKWAFDTYAPRREAVALSLACENRFTEPAVHFAINQQMSLLRPGDLGRWKGQREAAPRRRIGVIGAGNVPLADLQDFVAVLLSGHEYIGKVSSKSPHLLPAFAQDISMEAGIAPVRFVDSEGLLREADALIASGSEATIQDIRLRAAEAGMPSERLLLRGTGFGIAVLDGRETDAERSGLAEDILLHEGMGCRNVALIWAPFGMSPDPYLDIMAQFRTVFPASERTRGALKIPEAFLQAIGFPHAAGDGFLVSKGPPEILAPGHVRWTEYRDLSEVSQFLEENRGSIRVVVGSARLRNGGIAPPEPMGTAQRPRLDWQAGGRDVMEFLFGMI